MLCTHEIRNISSSLVFLCKYAKQIALPGRVQWIPFVCILLEFEADTACRGFKKTACTGSMQPLQART